MSSSIDAVITRPLLHDRETNPCEFVLIECSHCPVRERGTIEELSDAGWVDVQVYDGDSEYVIGQGDICPRCNAAGLIPYTQSVGSYDDDYDDDYDE